MAAQAFDSFIDANSYLHEGEGERLVLIHPFCTDAAVWRSTMPHLTDELEVFAPTVAGHNRGPKLGDDVSVVGLADSVERQMDAIGWDGTAHFAGNSLGGMLSLELAKRGRAETVTAIAPAGGWEAHSRAERLLMAKFATAFPLIKLLGVLPPQVADVVTFESHVRKMVMKPVVENGHVMSRKDAAHLIRAARGCKLFDHILDASTHKTGTTLTDLESIDNPVLLVTAEKDRVIPFGKYMLRFMNELPNLEHLELPGLGHCPQLEAPDVIAGAIKGHIRTQAALNEKVS